MFSLFNGDAREIRQLNKDARSIVEMARETYRSTLQRDIAVLTQQRLEQAQERCGEDEPCLKRELERLQALHRESRSRHDPVGLTAYTLVIIQLRSLRHGAACDPARASIGDFLAQWRHAGPDEGSLGA
jgi:hypothetical protein